MRPPLGLHLLNMPRPPTALVEQHVCALVRQDVQLLPGPSLAVLRLAQSIGLTNTSGEACGERGHRAEAERITDRGPAGAGRGGARASARRGGCGRTWSG